MIGCCSVVDVFDFEVVEVDCWLGQRHAVLAIAPSLPRPVLLSAFARAENFEVVVVNFVVVVAKPSEGCADRLLRYCLALAMVVAEDEVGSGLKLPQHLQLPQPFDFAKERSERSKQRAVKVNIRLGKKVP